MRLEIGETAPTFEAQCWDGARVDLDALRGGRTWLAFFRYASCPLCNLRVHEMISRQPDYTAAGLRIVAVFQSPADSMREHVGKQAPDFPLVCDPEERLYQLYGVERSVVGLLHPANALGLTRAMIAGFAPAKPDGSVDRLPADFLLDSELRIQDAYYARRIGDHIPFARVQAFLDA